MSANRSTLLKEAWPFAALCLLLNLAVFAVIACHRPAYLRDASLAPNPDAHHYVLLGRNFLRDGHYSRCSQPPYVPDILRTPVYPLVAGALDLLGGAGAIYLLQAVLQAASCLLVYRLVRPYFGARAAGCAALLLATDLMLVISNFEAMSEPLFTFLTLASVGCLLPVLLALREAPHAALRLAVGSLLLGLGILTRPTGLYLPFVVAAGLCYCGVRQHCFRRSLGYAALALVAALLPVAGWIARNAYVFSVARLTHNDAIMLVYFAGAGAYQVEHGLTLDQAQDRIAAEYALPSPAETNNHWASRWSVPEMDRALRQATRPVLLKYPRALVISSALAVVKASLSHNTAILATALGRTWVPPGAAALGARDAAVWDRLGQNGPLLTAVFGWEVLHAALTAGLALLGLWFALRDRTSRPFGLLLLGLLLYFLLTVAVVGAEAYCRSRSPHLPYVVAFAGLALARVARRRGSAPRRPAEEPSHAEPAACLP
jgi:4-amino-4-deoxy-L-arabinose transferase-like glycosyltransferase